VKITNSDFNYAKAALGQPSTWKPTDGFTKKELRRIAKIFAECRTMGRNNGFDAAATVALSHMPMMQCMSVEPIVEVCQLISDDIKSLKENDDDQC